MLRKMYRTFILKLKSIETQKNDDEMTPYAASIPRITYRIYGLRSMLSYYIDSASPV